MKELTNLVELYQNSILKYGDFPAFIIKDEKITYNEFDKKVAKLVKYLNKSKCKNIQIATENSFYFAIAYFGVIISNNIAVLNSNDDVQVDIALRLEDPDIEKIIKTEEYDEIKYFHEYDNESVSTILFSSGTTGEGKGIMLSMKNILATVLSCVKRVSYFNTDRCINIIPLNHIFGLIGDFLTTFFVGACMCIIETKYEFYYSLEKYKPDYLNLPPILIENLLEEIKKREQDFTGGNIRRIICAGASISNNIIQEYKKYNINILPCYGLTEAPCVSLCSDFDDKRNGVGKVIDCNEIYLDNNGQILVCGDSVMLGYTSEKENPFITINNKKYLKTKDVGKMDDNNLFILGRVDNIISLKNGIKVQKESIENKIKNLDTVKEVKVELKNDELIAEVVVEEKYRNEVERNIRRMNFGGNTIEKIIYVESIKKNFLGKVVRNGE